MDAFLDEIRWAIERVQCVRLLLGILVMALARIGKADLSSTLCWLDDDLLPQYRAARWDAGIATFQELLAWGVTEDVIRQASWLMFCHEPSSRTAGASICYTGVIVC